MRDITLKTDDCHFGDQLHKFRVRASAEFAFSMEVEAHDADEAVMVAENYCDGMDAASWQELAEHVHKKFEGEGT